MVLAPAVAGLLYGPLIYRYAREARGSGVPEVMLAVAENGGRIRPAVAVVKSLASAICIGGGGSVGREGPIVQIGSALGSSLGQRLRVAEPRLKLLLACGAAGGISATFNAPIAGVLFALELLLRDFSAESAGVVLLASVTADVIGRAAFGPAAFLSVPPFALPSPAGYGFYAGLGLCAAVVGVAFIVFAMASRTSPIGSGAGQSGCGQRWEGWGWGSCCWCCPRCTVSAIPCWRAPFASNMDRGC